MDEFELGKEEPAEKKGGFEDKMMGDMAASMKKAKKAAPFAEEPEPEEDMEDAANSEALAALQSELGLSPEDAQRAYDIVLENMGM